VECGSEYACRYGGESTMVIVLVYISSLTPFLLYLYGRLRCMFSTSYLGGAKQWCSMCKGQCIGYSSNGQRRWAGSMVHTYPNVQVQMAL